MGEISEKEQFSRRPRWTRFIACEALKINLSSIMVENQATTLAFYTGVLGFKKSKDIPVGEFRWVTVVSPDGHRDVKLVLEPNANPAAKAFQEATFKQGIPLVAFEADDIEAECHPRLLKHLRSHLRPVKSL
jgi:catechol 2,3-dioxygenase-like lactoylglutathione lyase family enzyme